MTLYCTVQFYPLIDSVNYIQPKLSFFVVWLMVFNATINNILVILWQLVLLVEEKIVLWENH